MFNQQQMWVDFATVYPNQLTETVGHLGRYCTTNGVTPAQPP